MWIGDEERLVIEMLEGLVNDIFAGVRPLSEAGSQLRRIKLETHSYQLRNGVDECFEALFHKKLSQVGIKRLIKTEPKPDLSVTLMYRCSPEGVTVGGTVKDPALLVCRDCGGWAELHPGLSDGSPVIVVCCSNCGTARTV